MVDTRNGRPITGALRNRLGRARRRHSEGDAARRTWYRKTSDGTFFRNCPLIMAEADEAVGARKGRLLDEWDECFREGVITASEISPDDRWIEYDDSPEANRRWVARMLAGRAEQQMRGGEA